MLEVNEIFGPTIQGEGKFVGNPSVFIRFGKCNFTCKGFNVEYETPSGIKKCACDSYYAVDKEFRDTWTKYKSYEDIVQEVEKLTSNYSYKMDIVITGGEPLLYWKQSQFQELLKYFIENKQQVTIETNASLNINLDSSFHKELIFSMSVKLSNSLEPLKKRVNKNTLREILNNTSQSYLKFVISKEFLEKAKNEIEDILEDIPKCDIYLMPMGDTAKQILQNSQEVITLAIQSGYKYCDRLHIRVWDNKRGV